MTGLLVVLVFFLEPRYIIIRFFTLRPRRRQPFGPALVAKRLLPVRVVADDQRAGGVGAQPAAAGDGQLVGELEAAGALDGLEGHLEVGDGLLVGDGRVGQDEGAQGDVAAHLAVLGEDDLVEVRGHRDRGGVADHLVPGVPLAVGGVALGEVEGAGDDAHARVAVGQTAAKVLEVGPVVPVEALADLGAHVAQVEGLVHGLLAPLAVGGGDLVAPVEARAEVVLQLGAELVGHALVLQEGRVLAVAVAAGERGRGDVLDDPVRVAQAAVVRGDQGLPRG